MASRFAYQIRVKVILFRNMLIEIVRLSLFSAYAAHQVYRARNITQRNISDIPITTRSTSAQGCRRERIDGANSYTLSLESRSALRLRDIHGVHYLPRRGHILIMQGGIKAIGNASRVAVTVSTTERTDLNYF